jgi:hypothetical protein
MTTARPSKEGRAVFHCIAPASRFAATRLCLCTKRTVSQLAKRAISERSASGQKNPGLSRGNDTLFNVSERLAARSPKR